MSNSAAVVAAGQSRVSADDEAKSIVVEAGSEPGDPHFVSLVVAAKKYIRSGMSRSENVQETIANLMGCRMRLQVEAESEVKELRRTILRMGKRRTRIDNLEERLNNLGPEEAHNFRTDVESAGYMMVKEDLVERIKVEKGNMQRDVEFAQRITEKIGEDLTGL